jgi:hypothetical protein
VIQGKDLPRRRPAKDASRAKDVKFETAVDEIGVPEMPVPEMPVPEMPVPEMQVPEMQVPEMQVPEMQVPEMQVPEMQLLVSHASSLEVKSLEAMRDGIGMIEVVEEIANRLVAMCEVAKRVVIATRPVMLPVMLLERVAIVMSREMLSRCEENEFPVTVVPVSVVPVSGDLANAVREKVAPIAANLHAANLNAVVIRDDVLIVDRLMLDSPVKAAVRNHVVESLGKRRRVSLSHVPSTIDLLTMI